MLGKRGWGRRCVRGFRAEKDMSGRAMPGPSTRLQNRVHALDPGLLPHDTLRRATA